MQIKFNEEKHSYHGLIDGKLEPLLNASTFKKIYEPEFKSFIVAFVKAKSTGEDPIDILEGWNLKGKASRNYGSGLHETLRLH